MPMNQEGHAGAAPESANNPKTCWKSMRRLVSSIIPVEIDLENRQIHVEDQLLQSIGAGISSRNIDAFILSHVDAADIEILTNSLAQAGKGIEKPIVFSFMHPRRRKKLWLEYRYQIVYVSYAKTRLKGELVNVRRRQPAG